MADIQAAPAPAPTPVLEKATVTSSKETTTLKPKGVAWTKPAGPYAQERALDDLPAVHHALVLFLESQMLESEAFIRENDEKLERLYSATGIGLIDVIRGLMSFEDKDLAHAIASLKHGAQIAQQHRKPLPFASRLAGLVLGSSGVNHVRGMTDVQRHAELVYAESLLEKAVVGIVYSGDWLQFIKEALNMRTATGIYRTLLAYLQAQDAAGLGDSVDPHFRSGVMLGMGLTSLVLSLMPGRVLTIMELFGYKGDRTDALNTLMSPGAWSTSSPTSASVEGVRRPICDMALLIFHLVLGGFTVQGIDIETAERILEFNLERFPNGVFFLFASARAHLVRSQPSSAVHAYTKALQSQSQYPQLHYLAHWELAVCHLARWSVEESLREWRRLVDGKASWSRACYAYGAAACLLQIGGDEERKEAASILETIPSLLNRIGGKSIPVEKFVARKARKFQSQGGRLLLPGVELAYFFSALAHSPAHVLRDRVLPVVDVEVDKHKQAEKDGKAKKDGGVVWDDVCLALFLRGVVLRYIAYPDPDARPDPADAQGDGVGTETETGREADEAQKAFERVLELGAKVEYDHWLLYYSHYELGRLLACRGDKAGARQHLELVASGKHLESSASARKGKYSMENALQVKTHAALEVLDSRHRL
ncbi:hypothetical protein EXIGLDRAFT_728589 [Exidia glandulosa HHB12029]|uniref:Tetratricopeptide repeat protein 39B n=1 Tax=Exidia glandulosa HHB12029 TaxID=1314781 RepID=A0A165Q4E3_EXIGL|nr:hypothetical protein EXIGLDRAFT_728589 [Exidia glandulosa HHB12029]